MVFTNNGCYNCDIPCEQQEFDSKRELFECHEKCDKNKVIYPFNILKDNKKFELALINRFNRMPGAKSIKY